MKKKSILLSFLLTSNLSFAFDLNNIVNTAVNTINEPSSNNTKLNLSEATIEKGLKEALKNASKYAIKELGETNGYFNNSLAKVILPSNIAKYEHLIRKAGGDKIVDNLIKSMNDAATQAAPKTAHIFIKAINKMSINDARAILSGNENAATNYFKENTTKDLKELIKPIIQKTMEDNKVANYYDMANGFYKSNLQDMVKNSEAMNLAKNFGVESYIPNSEKNIDDHVTDSAINGLFKIIAQKESEIRKNPKEHITSVLKKVFGK